MPHNVVQIGEDVSVCESMFWAFLLKMDSHKIAIFLAGGTCAGARRVGACAPKKAPTLNPPLRFFLCDVVALEAGEGGVGCHAIRNLSVCF